MTQNHQNPSLKRLRLLPKLLTPRESLAIKIFISLIVISSAFLLTRLYISGSKIVPKSGGEYVEGVIGSPKLINPIFASTNDVDMDISSLVFSPLTDLMERYTASSDLKTYTIYLKKKVKWHDGEDFDADDVIFTALSIQDPDYKSPLAGSLKGAIVKKINKYTIEFDLLEPFAPFISLLNFGIIPEHIWSEIEPQSASLSELNIRAPVGTGPFKFKSFKRGQKGTIHSYKLIRHKDYFGKKPWLDSITFKFYPDFESALSALNSKNIDGASFLPFNLLSKITNKEVKKHFLPLSQYTAIFFNQKNNEAVASKEIRLALSYALNKKHILDEALGGQGAVIDAPILPGYVGYHAAVQKYNFDLKKAKEIVDKIKKDKPIKITLSTVERDENVKAAKIIQNYWKEIGIDTTLEIAKPEDINKEIIKPRKYQALLYGEILGGDPDPYAFWHSSQNHNGGLNLANFQNKKADLLLEDARKTGKDEERTKKYHEFQDIIALEIPAIFLFSPHYPYIVSSKIKGIESKRIILPRDRFENIENWYIKTKRTLR